MENINKYNVVLSIAGSDSGGCAGIQADIKSISANGAFATTVITAITAQNTVGVTDVFPLPVTSIKKQLKAVLDDINVAAIKIGMLHSTEVINTVKQTLSDYNKNNIVLDPVMVATSGDKLITDSAIESLKQFLPSAKLITPNLPEAAILLDEKITINNIESSAKKIAEKYNTSVLLKGGHLQETSVLKDVLYNIQNNQTTVFKNQFVKTKNTHGTGCSLSSSIAAFLSLNYNLEQSVEKSINYINNAIKAGKNKVLGKGNGPIHHFYIQS